MSESLALTFNVLIKREGDLCVAHCLELDIVATGISPEEARTDVIDLIKAQVEYAFHYKNLDHLYRPAPAEIWKEFYKCKEAIANRFEVEPRLGEQGDIQEFVPPWIIANICNTSELCQYV